MRRFVVLEHTVRPGEVHFDLMIEDGAVLVTFQLDAPLDAPRAKVRGRRSFDHRPRYLDYEGPIAGDRGAVRIRTRGHVEDVEGAPRDATYRGRLAGDLGTGLLVVRARGAAPASVEGRPPDHVVEVEVEPEPPRQVVDVELEAGIEGPPA